MFDIGMQELIVIFIVALIVFGPKRLPELGKTLGKAMAELKRAMYNVKEQMDSEMQDIKRPMSIENLIEEVDKSTADANSDKKAGDGEEKKSG